VGGTIVLWKALFEAKGIVPRHNYGATTEINSMAVMIDWLTDGHDFNLKLA